MEGKLLSRGQPARQTNQADQSSANLAGSQPAINQIDSWC